MRTLVALVFRARSLVSRSPSSPSMWHTSSYDIPGRIRWPRSQRNDLRLRVSTYSRRCSSSVRGPGAESPSLALNDSLSECVHEGDSQPAPVRAARPAPKIAMISILNRMVAIPGPNLPVNTRSTGAESSSNVHFVARPRFLPSRRPRLRAGPDEGGQNRHDDRDRDGIDQDAPVDP